MKYDHKEIDAKWQKKWMDAKAFEVDEKSKKEPFYCLVEFPYPSGAGLHMGHPRSYTALDVLARKRRMQGYEVLYPMGYDAFGLPTENYAIKTGRKPQEVTKENIETFRRQLQSLGFSFDWSREINTTDPEYYKWTQWMFLEMFKNDLAYKDKKAINWCKSCKIGLANEEVVNGACERCGGEVEKRDKEQWMIAITKYADRLLEDLEGVDYPERVKKQQIDWIGKSEGAEVEFSIDDEAVTVFTTRPDTLFGATYMVLAPEHELVDKIVTDEYRKDVEKYRKEAASKTDIDRSDETKEKTGVFTGAYAVNPVNDEKIPVWIADYVMMGYGTGAIMAVPAHDTRDFEFAKKFDLPIIEVVSGGDVSKEAYVGDGKLVNSDMLDGLEVPKAIEKITKWLEKNKTGKAAVNYRLRDWVFSRQRYWGEPIPLIECEKCGWVAVPEDQLPVELPEVEKYEPTDTGESPLAAIEDWVNTECPSCGGPAKRETDTMPNWAGSSWYFLRYIDPKNNKTFADKKLLKKWMPVNWYNGGMEHVTLHLLYSRFWNKVLFDLGHVPVSEPYAKRTSHGLIMSEDGTKMSKSKGNVVNPDEVVEKYGADALRLYQCFIGSFSEAAPWNDQGVVGVRRFLEKVMSIVEADEVTAQEGGKDINKMVKKVGEDIDEMKFNTAVAAMMEYVNSTGGKMARGDKETLLKVLNVFAPHVAEEGWEMLGNEGLVCEQPWPQYDPKQIVDDTVVLGVQVNGKVRGEVEVAVDASEDEARTAAEAIESVAKHLEGKEVAKFVYVPGKIISFVAK